MKKTLAFTEITNLHEDFPVVTLVWQGNSLIRLLFGPASQIKKDDYLLRHFADHDFVKTDEVKGVAKHALAGLKEYFANGKPKTSKLKYHLCGTSFQTQVWRAIQEIPYGKSSSYGDIAKLIHRPRAVRAVGRAAGENPLPILIPCHRVIGKDGSLVGFTGGISRKKHLLSQEGVPFRA